MVVVVPLLLRSEEEAAQPRCHEARLASARASALGASSHDAGRNRAPSGKELRFLWCSRALELPPMRMGTGLPDKGGTGRKLDADTPNAAEADADEAAPDDTAHVREAEGRD